MDGDIASKLGSLLSDPQALSSLMSVVGPMLSGGGSAAEAPSEPAPSSPEPELPVSSFNFGSRLDSSGGSFDKRCELLRALKPYLRSERAGRVDMMIQMLQLLSLAKSSGLLPGRRD